MVENVSNNMSKVKNIEVQPITTCSYKKKSVLKIENLGFEMETMQRLRLLHKHTKNSDSLSFGLTRKI